MELEYAVGKRRLSFIVLRFTYLKEFKKERERQKDIDV